MAVPANADIGAKPMAAAEGAWEAQQVAGAQVGVAPSGVARRPLPCREGGHVGADARRVAVHVDGARRRRPARVGPERDSGDEVSVDVVVADVGRRKTRDGADVKGEAPLVPRDTDPLGRNERRQDGVQSQR